MSARTVKLLADYALELDLANNTLKRKFDSAKFKAEDIPALEIHFQDDKIQDTNNQYKIPIYVLNKSNTKMFDLDCEIYIIVEIENGFKILPARSRVMGARSLVPNEGLTNIIYLDKNLSKQFFFSIKVKFRGLTRPYDYIEHYIFRNSDLKVANYYNMWPALEQFLQKNNLY